MNNGNISKSVVFLRNWRNPYIFLLLSIPFLQSFSEKNTDLEAEPPTLACVDPEPITRWNQLSPPMRSFLDDGTTATDVKDFNTGFCNGMGDPILVDIQSTGAAHSTNPAIINNALPSRWGLRSFNNSRSDPGESGVTYSFKFSEPLPLEVNSEEHQFLHDGEHIRVRAFVGTTPVNLSGTLNGASSQATMTGNGTSEIHYAANSHRGTGVWWSANTQGNAIDSVCVEYYRSGPGAANIGSEPFSLYICNSDRCIFDDPLAMAHPANPAPNVNIADNVLFTKETFCVEQSISGTPGNMDVTFSLRMKNNGSNVITDLQMVEDIYDQIPLGVFVDLLDVSFAPDNNLTSNPTFNNSFDGHTNTSIFTGSNGTMGPDQTLSVYLTVELDPNAMTQYEPIRNQAFGYGFGGSFNLITATSDAPVGAPGHNEGDAEGLFLYIPSLNVTVEAIDYDELPECDANGDVETTLRVRYANTGNVILDNLALRANLMSTLGGALVEVVDGPTITASGATSNPTLNLNYNGMASNDGLFNGSTGVLEQGQVITLEMTVRLDPNSLTAAPQQKAQFMGAARGVFIDLKPLPGCHDDEELWAFDESDVGDTPEDDNPGFFGDTGGHSDPLPLLSQNLFAVKEVVNFGPAASQTPGNLDVRFRMEMKNVGNVPLNNLNLIDPVASYFGSALVAVKQAPQVVSSSASSAPVLMGTFPNFFNGASGLLLPNQNIIMDFVLELNPDVLGLNYPILNQAEVNGTGPWIDGSLQTITAFSDSGNQTESTNPNEPGDNLCGNDATEVNLPALMVAQEVVGVDYAASGISGHFDAVVQVVVQNTGSVNLGDFSLLQNLSLPSQLGSTFVGAVGDPYLVPVGAHGTMATATTNPNPNPNYSGINDLLNGGGMVRPGEIFILQYRVEVNSEASGPPSNPKLQVVGYATGDGPYGNPMTVNDSSDAGYTPQGTNPNRPGNTGGSNDPSPLGNCGMEIGALACNNNIQVSMNEDCLAAIHPSMVLEGEFWQCADDDLLPLGAYYEIFMVTGPNGVLLTDAIPATPNVFEIDGSFVGQQLIVKARDVVNSNACWGTLSLEDKMGPSFDCPSPLLANCFDDLTAIAPPVATDNCDPNPTVTFIGQQIIDNDICNDGQYVVRRTYTANDQSGNQAPNQCIFDIQLSRPAVTFPKDINWSCTQYSSHPNIVEAATLNASVVDTDGSTLVIDAGTGLSANILANTGAGIVNNSGGVCSYHVTHSDQIAPACGNTFKIIRTWSVIDWCSGDVITVGANGNDNIQNIKILDKVAPVIVKTDFQVNATIPATQNSNCRSQGLLPPPDSYSDICQANADVNVQIITDIGEAIYIGADGSTGGMIPPPGLPIGFHTVEYRATDACGNTSSDFVQVQVMDGITPTAVCDELTEVALTNDGTATVLAATFDDGSHDNCCLDNNFQVRRMTDPCDDGMDDTVFGPSVTFCCDDVGTGPQMVVFRVFDCFGNFNDCMVEATVQDANAPLLINCPTNVRIDCETYADDFQSQLSILDGNPAAQNEFFDAQYGSAMFMDACGFTISKGFSQNLDQCLEGTLSRTWTAFDPDGLTSQTCTQTISVDHISNWVVEFAPDVEINCGQTLPDFVEPEIFFDDCEMVGVSFDDELFTTVVDACFKIQRTWVVINWCVLGELTDEEVVETPESGLGLAFPACDLDGDGDCDDRTFRDSWNLTDKPDASILTNSTGPDTDPDSDPWDGYITYTQTIKAVDTVDPVFVGGCPVIPDVCITGNTCTTTVTLPEPTAMDCSPNLNITATHSLGIGTGYGPFTDVGTGTYAITYTVIDNCNNQTSCQTSVTVNDCKAPSLVCRESVIAVLGEAPNPMAVVQVDSLVISSTDNCPGPLFFSFSDVDLTNTLDSFFCFNVGVNTVDVWVTDAAGNQDLCQPDIIIQDNMNHCNDDLLVVNLSGVIDTEDGEPVEGVYIALNGQMTDDQMTPLSGDFQFGDIPMGNDVTITPALNDAPLNGVTTYDLVLIAKHILGEQGLTSPYQFIAADANNSGSVTTYDMVEIRKLILQINDEFPNNTSWRFVDKNYVFPDPTNPWQEVFPEVINVNDIPGDVLDADFVAVKIGDLNGTASPNLLGSADDRSFDGMFTLSAEERNLTRGEKCSVTITANEATVEGFQFTLRFDPDKLAFLEVENALLEGKNFGYRFVDEGYLMVSWNGEMDTDLPTADLRFRALDNLRLGSAIQLNSRHTSAEAYGKNGDLLDVELVFTDGDAAGNFELYQNVPNPFSDATIISFRLPRASMATLTISDVQGRTVRTVTDLYEAGYNEIELGKDALPNNGVFYYRLETPTESDTKTMILLE